MMMIFLGYWSAIWPEIGEKMTRGNVLHNKLIANPIADPVTFKMYKLIPNPYTLFPIDEKSLLVTKTHRLYVAFLVFIK